MKIVCLLGQIVIESLQIGADKDVIVKSAFMLSFKACVTFFYGKQLEEEQVL